VAASLGANRAGEYTYALSRRWVDDLVTVEEDDIRAGFKACLTDGHILAEPGAAIAVAALLAGRVMPEPGQVTVAVITGGNMDMPKLRQLI
jgi:threonine dehydratase